MLYKKEIDNSVLIQFIILYTLNKADSPLPYNELINIVLDNCNINYNDFQVALANLVNTKHINTFLAGRHIQKFEITKKGLNARDFFTANIPVYIKEPIDNSIKALFKAERLKKAVRADITPVRKNEYRADCELYDDDNTQLMSLSLYAGSRSEAERMAVYFKNNSNIIYEKVLDAFNDTDSDKKS